MNIYEKQFKLSKELVGQKIIEVIFYLEPTDVDFTEQQNDFGKSLFNGIDIRTVDEIYSIGNRFSSFGYGLSIDIGKTTELESFECLKIPFEFETGIVNEKINEVNIYWMRTPFEDESNVYPQEIEIKTNSGYLILSSIEVYDGEVSTEFTDELLIIESEENAKKLRLGKFGTNQGRLTFRDHKEIK